ncbi:MAG: cytochrome c oxidase assembly protein [Candidatus Korobacteraceae bacterium]
MQPVLQAALRSWSIPPGATFALLLTALLYLRGWISLRRAGSLELPPWRAASFLAGLFFLWVALASPLDTFSGFVLTAHMLQHMLLMMVAPPLILLGAPLIPIVRGLPRFAAREFAGPFLNWPVANRIGTALTNPICALVLMGVVMFAWHTPRLYELALGSSSWHEVEHACFFVTSIIFWWPVVQPWPSRPQWPRWAMVPYLFVGDLQNTILSAILVFSDRVLYPSYAQIPRLFGLSAQADQAASGAIMWVLGGFAYVFPAVVIAINCLSKRSGQPNVIPPRREHVNEAPSPRGKFPLLGDLLRPKLGGKTGEMVWFVAVFVATGLCFAFLIANSSDDDDQALRVWTQTGPFSIAVFAPSGDLPAGPTNLGVLVQDRNTDEILLDSAIELTARPAADVGPLGPAVHASSADSENKLLQTAELDLPAPGDWTVNISLSRNSERAEVSLPLRIVKRESGLGDMWPYFIFPAFGMVLFGAYVRRHREAAVSPLEHVPS